MKRILYFVFSVVLSCNTYNQMAIADESLGVAKSHNLFLLENFKSQASDSQGPIAAGGDIWLRSYGVASTQPSQPQTATIVAGGDLDFDNGKIFVGSALVAGSTANVSQSVLSGLETGASINGGAALPFSFEEQFSELRQVSSALAQAESTGEVEYKWGGTYMTGDCASTTQVFNLDGAQVLASNTFALDCVPENATIVFNIDGETAGFKNVGLSQLRSRATRILYNFHEATLVQFTWIGIEGTVLAPLAHMDNPRGQVNGSVFAKSWDGPMELHHFPYEGDLGPLIGSANTAPVADSQTVQLDEDTETLITLTGSDQDDDPITFSIVSSPVNGHISGDAPNLIYSPNTTYNGVDSFTFIVNDGQADSGVAAVTINIAPINDPPTANPQTVSTQEDTELDIALTAVDTDSNALTYEIVSQPLNGTFIGAAPQLTYRPNTDFYGSDSFSFKANDGELDSNIATVEISIVQVNDRPVAQAQTLIIQEEQFANILLTGTDVDADSLTYSLTNAPLNGVLEGDLPNLIYTPNDDYNGNDSFSFLVNDDTLDSIEAQVDILVTPVNDAPIAVEQSLSTLEDINLALELSAQDVDSDVLVFTITAQPQLGTLVGEGASLTYHPNPNFNGQDSFSFVANDGEIDSSVAVVAIDILPQNDAPVAIEQTLETAFATAVAIELLGTDPDSDNLEFEVVSQPVNGSLSGDLPNLIYTPNDGYNGSDSFLYLTSDAEVASSDALVTIIVSPNQPPNIVTDAKANHVLQGVVGIAEPVDLSNWVTEVIWDGSQPGPQWELRDSGFSVFQKRNADPSFFLSDFELKNGQIKGQFSVSDFSDDDFIGFVFGHQNKKEFYLFDWKKRTQGAALVGMSVKRFTGPNFIDLWPTQITNGSGTNLYHNSLGWRVNVPYEFTLSFFPGEFSITVRDLQTNTVMDSFTVKDDLYKSGGFGFYNYSQEDVLYEGFSLETTADREYQYAVGAIDPEGDQLSYRLLDGPDGMTIEEQTGLISWFTTTDNLGEYPVSVEVSDAFGGADVQNYTLSVVDTVPVFTTQPSLVTEVNSLYAYAANAVDPNPGDVLTYTLIDGPERMVINETSGLINWYPLLDDIGVHSIDVQVQDSTGGYDRQRFDVNVIAVTDNPSPKVSSEPDAFAQIDREYVYKVDATDDGDLPLSFSLLTPPDGMVIDSESGLLRWTPNSSQTGDVEVTVRITDPLGGVTLHQFRVTVVDGSAGNNQPTIDSQPLRYARIGFDYVYQVQASDLDNDPLSYQVIDGPDGLTISNSGNVTWSPQAEGFFNVKVRVTDSNGLYVSQLWVIYVVPADVEFSANVSITPKIADEGDQVVIQVTPTLGEGSVIPSVTVDGNAITLDTTNSATVIASGIGAHVVEISLLSPYGTTLQTARFFVRDPNDLVVPEVSINRPADTQVITAPEPIVVSVQDDNLVEWSLLLQKKGAAQTDFITLATGTNSIVDEEVATLDPSLMRNGQYSLILRGTETSGIEVFDSINITIDEDLKVGNFSITYEDLNIPLVGIPISVRRTYDSRDRNESLDFGYGWNLDYQNVKVEESQVLGQGWDNYSRSGIIVIAYCVEPRQNPQVSITLPDGSVERFAAVVDPVCRRFIPRTFVKLGFAALGDTTSRLVALEEADAFFKNGNLVETGLFEKPIDPNKYLLTTKSGYKYYFDQSFGLTRVQDPNGNSLRYTDDGIIHSSGKSVQFVRDAQGRITEIIDPKGNALTYQYNNLGELASATERDLAKTDFTYNGTHGLVDIIDPLGRPILKNIYDDAGRLVAQEDDNGQRTEFNHNIEGRESVVTDRNGNVSFVYYDDEGNVTSRVDALGNTTSYTFDERGNQLTETDALGNVTSATYNNRDDQLTQTDALGNVTRFSYNTRGQETVIADARGNIFTNDYDGNTNLISITDSLGNVASTIVDARGLVTSTTDVLGNITNFTYDDEGNKLSETDAEGNVVAYTYDDNNNALTQTSTRMVNGTPTQETTTFEYDVRDRVVKTTDALGNESSTEYDLAGNEVAQVDALGRRTTMQYDSYNRLVLTTYPDGTTTSNSYDPEGNLLNSTDRLGRVTTNAYDALYRLVSVAQADGSVTRTEYDAIGRVTAEVDANLNRTVHAYDAANRRTSTTDALGNVTQFAYDADGNMVRMTDANGNTTSYTYNELDQKVQTTFQNASTMQEGLDALSRKTSMTDQAGVTTNYTYDKLGRLTKVTDALNQETSYSYDSIGNKLTQTDAQGRTTRWAYDALGRVISRTLPLGQVETMQYDAVGNVTQRTDFKGQISTYGYDVNNRMVSAVYEGGLSETYTYDALGNRTQSTKTENGVTSSWVYTYDNLNRLSSETQFTGTADEVTLSYEYDAQGNRTVLTETTATETRITRYTFDVLNRLKTVQDPDGNTTAYSYDAVGNRIGMSHQNGIQTGYVYDELNRLTSVEHQNAINVTLKKFDYELLANGKRSKITEANGRTTDYTYDLLYRLTQEAIFDPVNASHSAAYTYDQVGNRTFEVVNGVSTQYTYNANDWLVQTGGTLYTYDANGSTLTETLDGNVGNFSYNAKNELISQNKAAVNTVYLYNTDGIRIGQGNSASQTLYTLDNNRSYAQVISEVIDGAQSVNYTYGDDLVSQKRGTLSTYHYDGLGSTRALSDAAGAVTDTYDYDAFGETLNQTGTTENNYLFTGEQFDPNLDQYYLRARYYDQGIGRFTQMDTWMGINSDPVTLHKYLYANVDPVNMVDPTGKFASLGGFSAGSSVGGVLSTLSIASTAFDVFQIATGEQEFSARQFATSILLSRLPVKYVKQLAARYKKKTGKTLRIPCVGNSFIAGTLIHTEDELKSIEEIEIGDKVLSYNEVTGEKEYQEVTHLIHGEKEYEIVNIGFGSEELTSTANHTFYVDGLWVRADELEDTANLSLIDGDSPVSKLVNETKFTNVYNITVAKNHNYYVSKSGVLVHNEDRDCVPAVANMGQFFETVFGLGIKNVSRKSSKIIQGQSVYKVTKNSGPLKKGQQYYLDNPHKDHLEVFDKNGRFLRVLNLDGTENIAKTAAAAGRSIGK